MFWLFFLVFIIFLCYGSFLNMVAYRLISGDSLLIPNSFCPKCKHTIAWYDLVPILSWIILRAKCRTCKSKISYLYPFIECFTAISFLTLFIAVPSYYWLGYGIFLSALIVTIRTDLETMLISRFATLFMIPFAFVFSAINYIPINFYQSLSGSIFGYLILWIVNKIFYALKKQQGIGEGDFDLLAMIGSFTGIHGVWITLLLSSMLASVISLFLIVLKKITKNSMVPFGPFIAIGAIIYLFTNAYHINLLDYLLFW